MGTDAGDRRVMRINDRAEGMRPQHELLERAFAAYPGKADAGMHGAQRVAVKAGFLKRDTAGFFYLDKRAIDSQPQRGGAGNAAAKETPTAVLDARTAAGAATVDAGEQDTS
jgi:hypothetical protein